MYPRRMMVAGAILVLAAIGILIAGLFITGEQESAINGATPFDGGPSVAGTRVIVEGKVGDRNAILKLDYVYGARESNQKGGSWTILEAYVQPLVLDLASGGIVLNTKGVCTEGKAGNILNTDEKDANGRQVRYTGLKRGDRVSAVGTLTSSDPPEMEVGHCYAGTVSEFRDSVSSSRRTSYIFCTVIALAGALMFFLGFRRR